MKEVTTDEVVESFKCARNLNAALKNLLKKEASHNEALGRFAKSFRTAVSGVNATSAMKFFVEKNYKNEDLFFLAAARYAHTEFLEKLIDQVITDHGEEFNQTYTLGQNSIEIKDKAKFTSIAQEVSVKADAALKEASLPVCSFMKLAFYHSLFEPQVLREVLKLQ